MSIVTRIKKMLIANRGEIAIRIARTAAEMNIETVAVYSRDDARSLHIKHMDHSVELLGGGVNAYLDIKNIINAALKSGCDAVHPGYGLLSENVNLAQACTDNGLVFIGPEVSTLKDFGDKVSARLLADAAGVPVIAGNNGIKSAADAITFFNEQGQNPIMLKAVAGGGGRGIRVVEQANQIETAFTRCQAEAKVAFGSSHLYVECYLPSVRHVEIQIAGDGHQVIHLWERDCTLQRHNQKMIEIAPAPGLSQDFKQQLFDAAIAIGQASSYKGLGTVEFLVTLDSNGLAQAFFFIETNPRIQVEHTITEEITGIDLVALQLRLASGETLKDIGMEQNTIPATVGYALQARINTETINDQGEIIPTGGTIDHFQLPNGPGIRVDTHGYSGYSPHLGFDSLLAKLIVHSRSEELLPLLVKAERALSEVKISGVESNVNFLQRLLSFPAVQKWQVSVRGIEQCFNEINSQQTESKKRYFVDIVTPDNVTPDIATSDDLVAVDKSDWPHDVEPIYAPLQSVLVSIEVQEGQMINAGDELAVVEAMKMQHVIKSTHAGEVLQVIACPGDSLNTHQAILLVCQRDASEQMQPEQIEQDLDVIRPDLAALKKLLAITQDQHRPEVVQKRHQRGQRMARENIADLCDDNSFMEYGQLVYAGQRRRRPKQRLREESPADGIVTGFGAVNGQLFDGGVSRTAVLAYDATVMAGTQGAHGHHKTDRTLEVAIDLGLPLVFFTEGGGGRPGDEDFSDIVATGLHIKTFHSMAKLHGRGPKIAVNSGYCFAGNAAIFGCCDIKISTRDSWIGMGGPAMIEGGGLGSYSPKEIGPAGMQAKNGLIDIIVDNDEQAVNYAKSVLSYFQGSMQKFDIADQRLLRHAIPEDRKRVYDIRSLITILADKESFLEVKQKYGVALVSGFIRIAGKPMGLIANNPMHLGGAINAAASDKAARFLQLCNKFKLPVLSLCDTPGFMVGPESESEGGVSRSCEFMLAGATLNVPLLMVCLRKGYGLGAMAMAGGSFSTTVSSVAWPTGEFGGMGLEGSVRLGYRRELDAQPDEQSRQALFDKLLKQAYDVGSASSVASLMEIDAVIDPEETRSWIINMMTAY